MTGNSQLLMTSGGPRITIADRTVDHSVTTPTNAEAGYQLESDGDIADGQGGIFSDVGDWIVPKAAAGASWECRATIISGTFDTGTAGTWLALSSNRTWTKARTSDVPGTNTVSFTLEIRHAVSLKVYASKTITLNAIVGA